MSCLLTTMIFFLVGEEPLLTLPNDIRFPIDGCDADSGLWRIAPGY